MGIRPGHDGALLGVRSERLGSDDSTVVDAEGRALRSCHLADLREGAPARFVGELRLESEDGGPLSRAWSVGRGSRLTLVDAMRCDGLDLPDQPWR